MTDDLERAVGPSRRTFVKRLVIGTAFAAPVVSSFSMSGVSAVFGDSPRSTTMGANSNTTTPTAPANYPTEVECVQFGSGGTTINAMDGAVELTLVVPPGVLPSGTIVCIYKGDLTALGSEVPAGQTPLSAYYVVWNSPPGDSQPDALPPGLTLTVTDPAVSAGDPIYLFDKSTGDVVSMGTATSSTWVVNFVQDPGFVVTTPAAATPPAGGPAPVIAGPQTTG